MSREPPGLTMVEPASLCSRRVLSPLFTQEALIMLSAPLYAHSRAYAHTVARYRLSFHTDYSLTNRVSVAKACAISRRSGQIAIAHGIPERLVWALDRVRELAAHIDRCEQSVLRADNHRLRVGENLGR